MGIFDSLDMPKRRAGSEQAMRDVVNRGIAGVLGGPVDLAALALKPLGYDHPAPIGSSEWIGNLMQQAGIVSPQRYPLPEALISLGFPLGAISPVGKARLLADLKAGKGSGTYPLGEVTEGQGKGLNSLFGNESAGRTVFMTDEAAAHLLARRVQGNKFTPEDVAKFTEQAMASRARPDLNVAKTAQNPSLLNSGMRDPLTGRPYDARMPLRQLEDGYEVRSVIPEGLPPRNEKTPKR
ncbi:hypothetical protein [Comamonas sp. GB3 AK4-5]|uniref:hypothetical protein n=1 Tax=Comamonas sp. GB3 AK4-5 TaxID=3231487 RepID=UPI00351F23D5